MTLWLWLLLACRTHDPLADLRTQYQQADTTDTAPHGTLNIRLDDSLADRLAARVPTKFRVTGPLGIRAAVRLDIEQSALVALASPCPHCVRGRASVSGTLRLDLAGTVTANLPWSANLDLDAQLGIRRDEGLTEVYVQQRKPTRSDVNLEGLPPLWAGLVSSVLSQELDRVAATWLETPLPLAKLGKVPLQRVEVRPSEQRLAVDFWWVAPDSGAPPPRAPDAAWALTLSDAGVLGLARASLLAEPPKRYMLLPTELETDHRAARAIVRLVRSGRGAYRDAEITGQLDVEDGALVLSVDHVEELDRWGFQLDPVGPIVKQRLAKGLGAGLAFPLPDNDLWTLDRAHTTPGGVMLLGSISPPPAPAPQ